MIELFSIGNRVYNGNKLGSNEIRKVKELSPLLPRWSLHVRAWSSFRVSGTTEVTKFQQQKITWYST
ncbi:hypothetical protein J6590_025396 [Homalodisca vitripennis]|nr:hypothetical protein J6590_025396 [Homalodisca vitripennis]